MPILRAAPRRTFAYARRGWLGKNLLAGPGLFPSADGMILGAGWSISNGQLVGVPDASAQTALWPMWLPAGTYRFSFELVARSAGTAQTRFTGAPGGIISGTGRSVVQVWTEDMVTPGSQNVGMSKAAAFNGTIDNLSLVRIA